MFFLKKRSNFEKNTHELSYRSNIVIKIEEVRENNFFDYQFIKLRIGPWCP